jgi:hypothetical protein
VATRPDDENREPIAYWANGSLYETAYLSLTRGDGGQNLIGPELGWQAAAAAANNLNQSLNKINVNGKITRILFLSTRTDPRQEVELEASREPASEITQVEISSPLPKSDIESE